MRKLYEGIPTCALRGASPSAGSGWAPVRRSAAGTGAPRRGPPARGSQAPPSRACRTCPGITPSYMQLIPGFYTSRGENATL